jgi:DNA-binding IclR family transcriptional regulator
MPTNRGIELDEDRPPEGGSGALIHRAPAVTRAATILRLLAGQRAGLGVSEIARRVGLVPSTCLHVLRALVEEGLVAFDDEKKTYRTGVGLLTLVRTAIANSSYPKVVQPVLEALARELPVTAVAVELDRRERMVVVALARSDAFISLHINIGSRFPAFLSATGRCFAAASGLDETELKARFDALRWDKAPRFEDWYQEVERARQQGTATDHGNYVRGLTVVAASLPVAPDGIHRGLAIVGFEHQLTERALRQIRASLLSAAEEVASQLN